MGTVSHGRAVSWCASLTLPAGGSKPSGYSNIGHDSAVVKRVEKKVSTADGAAGADRSLGTRLTIRNRRKTRQGCQRRYARIPRKTRPAMIQPNFASRRCATHGNSSESLRAARNAACGKRPWRQAGETPDDLDTQPPGGEFDAFDFAGSSVFRIAAARRARRLRCCRKMRQTLTAFPLRTDWVSF